MRVKTPAREIIKPYVDKDMSIQEIVDITGIKYATVQAARFRLLGNHEKTQNVKRKKGWNQDRKACRRCKYRGDRRMVTNNCDYIVITGHSRGCPAADCDKYVRGQRVRRDKGAPTEMEK